MILPRRGLIKGMSAMAAYATLETAARALPGPKPTTLFSKPPAAGFTPKSIAGCQLWFDASNAGSVSLSGSTVTQWGDLSGNANNATIPGGYTGPTLTTGNAPSGLNSILFGSGQVLGLANSINVDAAYTCAAVISPNAGGSVEVIGDRINNFGTGLLEWYIGAAIYFFNSSSEIYAAKVGSGFHQITTTLTGSTAQIFYDSASVTPGVFGAALPATTINTIGLSDSSYSNGYFCEFAVYNTVISGANITNLYNYFKAKWGTP